MTATRVLYWGSGSPPAWRVLAALEEKKLSFESKVVEFSKGGHKCAEIMAMNPRGQVPTFKDGDAVVNESLAILEYLEKAYPDHPLMPKEKTGYALVFQRTHETNNLTTAFRDVAIPKMRGTIKTEEDQKAWLEKVEATKKELAYWESYLEAESFIAGSTFSMADLAAAPLLLAFRRFGASFEGFPKLKAYIEKMGAWPSIAKTAPPHWADSPAPTHLVGHL